MNKKTTKQKINANGKRAKAQNKHKTVAKELLLIKKETSLINGDYPHMLDTLESKLYYDALIASCQSMSFLFHDCDKLRVAILSRLMVMCDTLLNNSEQMIIEEINGNTQKSQQKINPNLILYVQLDRRIDLKLKDLGLTPQIRADILQKVSTLLSDDVIDNKTAQSNKLGPTLDSFIGKHKITAN